VTRAVVSLVAPQDIGRASGSYSTVRQLGGAFGVAVLGAVFAVSASGATATGGAHDEKWYDVQTKFDLAKAYQEMGDKEGAREILREVIAEGDTEQKSAAEKVLETL